jgi:hypothetical protein
MKTLSALAFLGGLALAACEGPALPSVVTGETMCKDFQQAGQTLKGGLKHPVRLRVLDGKDVIATVMLYGLSETNSAPTRFLLPDTNEKYTLEWAQCKVVRAPTANDPRDKAAQRQSGGGSYDCADAEVYEKVEHNTKKGDISTHELKMVEPPDPTCW